MSGTFASLLPTQANRFSQMYVNGFVDVSCGNVLLRGDAGANHLILQNGDISLNGRLFATRDISLNGNLNIGGNLSVSQFSSNKTITTTNYQLVVAEDLSLNGRLFVSSDASFSGRLFVAGPVTLNSTSGVTISNPTNTTTPISLYPYLGAGSYNSIVANNDAAIIFGDGGGGTRGFSIAPWGSGVTTGIRITSGGNVGIGVTNPAYTLDVSAASTAPFRVGVGSTNAIAVNSSGNVGIGTTNPQAALDVYGAIRVSGGITPIYSTPSFSAGQVGYVYNGTFNTTTTYGTSWQTISTISIATPGIYLLSGTASALTAQTGPYIGCGLYSGDSSDFTIQSYGGRTAISGVVTVSSPNTNVYLSYSFTTSSKLDGNHLIFTATRIA